ncbi:MAG: FAD-dependent oxidoreductase [Acidimicrobiia bacterium]
MTDRSGRRDRIAILGGGMAAMAAAWRLSEPGWRDEFESITVYQRGWRLGGKGASSRGAHGRIEEHGLHVWLGSYDNAFRLLRECYAELDRPTTDPTAHLQTWRDAMIPAPSLGLEDLRDEGWSHWLGTFSTNAELPGDPCTDGRELTAVEFVARSVLLILDFIKSVPDPATPRSQSGITGVAVIAAALGALLEVTRRSDPDGSRDDGALLRGIDDALTMIRSNIGDPADGGPELRRTWSLISLMTSVVRGIVADELATHPAGFRAVNDEDFLEWVIRHGASPAVADLAFVRGLYDLVFGYENADPKRPRFPAGLAAFLSGKMLFDYKGAIYWKMTAGMGDVVFAPMYQVLAERGVQFEFFHRVDALHLSPDRQAIDAITVGRQVALESGRTHYEPLVRVGDLPCFPKEPLIEQLDADGAVVDQPLESHWCSWPDAETRVLRRGEDFDSVVLAIPVGMAPVLCQELIADRPEWKEMVDHLATIATQSFQVWLREDEPTLGWDHPGVTISAYEHPFSTWASMPQLIDAEPWPEDDRPGTIAYFCGVLDATWPDDSVGPAYANRYREHTRREAVQFLERYAGHLLPGVEGPDGFRWELLCGRDGKVGPDAFDTQYWVANVDPSDRYVSSLPGSDRYRLRSDESGYDNLFLAGDWTDSGINAGCIEAAVLSGLQAANAIRGRPRAHRIAGYYLP